MSRKPARPPSRRTRLRLPPLRDSTPWGPRLRRLLLPLTLAVLLLLGAFAAWVVDTYELELGGAVGVAAGSTDDGADSSPDR